MSKWRVSYFDAGGEGHFADVEAVNSNTAAWNVAIKLDSDISTLADVRAIDD